MSIAIPTPARVLLSRRDNAPNHLLMNLRTALRPAALLLIAACLALNGCTTIPSALPCDGPMQDRLAADIHFLSGPKLKGRKMGSAGARLARRYIKKQYAACGLVPWGKQQSYELSFRLGKNVVGLLPGSDTNLSGEIVLLSAHYDHLGKDSRGRVCPGAADNASGVAVLLEAARQLSLPGHHPKRTIAFTAFDAEEQMLLGSFAFTCRPDVEQAKIVAVVNVDMVGRDFMDVVPDTLFVAGTEGHPALRDQVRRFGSQAGIRVLPLGSDLIGPRGDHAAFETRDLPCLFFSCGTFRDYHQWGDTADKLNYAEVERSARVVIATVESLARDNCSGSTVTSGNDREELESLRLVLSELCRDPKQAGLKARDVEALGQLQAKIEKLAAGGTYDRAAREKLLIDASTSLMPYTLGAGGLTQAGNPLARALLPVMAHLYLNYHRQMLEGQKQLVAAFLKHPPGLFHRLQPFNYEIYDLLDDDISVTQTGNGTLALHALVSDSTWKASSRPLFWPFQSFSVVITGSLEPLDCEGTRQDLTDLCLLRLRPSQTNQLHLQAIRKVLRAINGADPKGGCHEWLQARLAQGGLKDETDWLLGCLSSGNPSLTYEALSAARDSRDQRILETARDLMLDRAVRPDVRAQAMWLAAHHPDHATLLALTEVLNDPNAVDSPKYCPLLQPGYPLASNATCSAFHPLLEWRYSHGKKTLGQTAREQLKRLTRKDFGTDAPKWKSWVQRSRHLSDAHTPETGS